MDKLEPRVEHAIKERIFPGCVIGIIHDGVRHIQAFGSTDYDKTAVTENTVYDLASITKSIPLAALVAMFLAEGKLRVDDTVRRYVPEMVNDYGATVEDLLRYRVRGVQMSTLGFSTFEEVRTHALEGGFDGPPSEYAYTNLPAFVLGIIIERLGGAMLPTLAHRYFFGPFGMEETSFFPSRDDCAPTEIIDDELVQGIVHDESARIFSRARRAVGHAGLFSTAGDLLNFSEKIIDEPESPIVLGAQQGLGWQVNDPAFMGIHAGPRVFGKTGFTGTSIMVDVERKMALVILSNRTYPHRPANDSAIFALRRDITDIVFG